MLAASNIQYELSAWERGLCAGGIGAVHLLARNYVLIDRIDRRLQLLKVHLPYHESDHVLNIAYNVICGGDCLQDIELLRNDEAYLDGLGASRIPDPTTAGDFCDSTDFDELSRIELAEVCLGGAVLSDSSHCSIKGRYRSITGDFLSTPIW